MSDEMMADIQRTLGRIEQKIDSHTVAFNQHIAMDLEAYKAIGALQKDVARQKGFVTSMGVIGGAVISAIAWIADRLLGIGHH